MAVISEKQGKRIIIGVSIVIPLVVMVLYFLPPVEVESDITVLPMFNAFVNGLTSLVLIAALVAIKQGKKELHKKLMVGALTLSVLFLLSYVTYHYLSESTPFGGEGAAKAIYYFILITHVLLAIAIVPLVLITTVRALSDQFDRHKKIARITWPLWLYVTITGVVVYLMISPYYS